MTESARVDETPRPALGGRAVFLVWGPPGHGPRSRVFARALGIDAHFIGCIRRRGLLAAPLKYTCMTAKTALFLARVRPRVVFVQSPPSIAVLVVCAYCLISGASYVVDAHSAALQSRWWTRPRWLFRLLASTAVATIVTGDHFAGVVRGSGGRALVIPDIPTTFPTAAASPTGKGFNIVVVSTFAHDEPLAEVLEAAAGTPEVRFHITGDSDRARARLNGSLPQNVRLTGYLPDEDYYALLAASDAVMCLTTRDNTMQRGGCEALSIGTPLITSRWPILESYFDRGAVHVDNTAPGIADGIRDMLAHHERFRIEIAELRETRRRDWREVRERLERLLEERRRLGPGRGMDDDG